ncbi:MAG: hypothetical protein ACLQE9_17445 [Roseiarcus sp.]
MRVRARIVLVEALRHARRWLDDLTSGSSHTVESPAFAAPDIVEAAIEGRLPRGFGVKRLIDLPMARPQQWRALGLKTPMPT